MILQGGSATSTRLRGEPNAFNWVTIDGPGAIAVRRLVWAEGAWVESGAVAAAVEAA